MKTLWHCHMGIYVWFYIEYTVGPNLTTVWNLDIYFWLFGHGGSWAFSCCFECFNATISVNFGIYILDITLIFLTKSTDIWNKPSLP